MRGEKSSVRGGYKSGVKGAIGGAFAIIGSVIGAGFITGREILSFFYGQTPIFVFVLLFVLFAAAFYCVLSARNRAQVRVLEFGDKGVCFLNLLSVASMLSATEGLAADVGIGCSIPAWSLLMLGLSLLVCARGMRGLAVFNAVLVPVMLAVVFFFSFAEIISGGANPNGGFGGSVLLKIKPSSAIIYVGMNALLTQPLLSGMREDNSNNRVFALIVALLSAFLLAVTAALFLAVLPTESLLSDIPVLYISGGGTAARVVIAATVLFGIVTTLVGSLYPLLNVVAVKSVGFSNEKSPRFSNIKSLNLGVLYKFGVCLLALAVSRLGFYTIVEKIYPIIGVLAVFYYLFVFAALPAFCSLKAAIKRACNRKSAKRRLLASRR